MNATSARSFAATVLVVTAHPDDAEFGAGGSVAAWSTSGMTVVLCVCTSGEAGVEPTDSRSPGEVRRAEQAAAAAELGISDVLYLDHPDGCVENTLSLRRDITRVIRQVRPFRVLTHCPTPDWARIATTHPDHLAVGTATAGAVYPDSRSRAAHPQLREEGLEPWTVSELWMMTPPISAENHAVDVTDHVTSKLDALAAHASQFPDNREVGAIAKFQMRQAAARHKLNGRFAEAFQTVRAV